MTTLKTPLMCKLEIENKVIEQEMKFKYLGIEISGYDDIEVDVREQTMRATECLKRHNVDKHKYWNRNKIKNSQGNRETNYDPYPRN